MDQTSPFPTAAFGVMGVMFTIYFLVMVAVTVTVVVALWRGMRAHEQIAATLRELSADLSASRRERPSQ